jgi:hypothetical protein
VTGPEAPADRSGRGRSALGWSLAIGCVLYALLVHHGIGPGPVGVDLRWYEPRGFLLRWGWLSFAFESAPRLIVLLTLPAVALALAVVATTASALARAISLICAIATPLFLFYGDQATRVWEWFGWRGSAVLSLLAVCVGLPLAAPLLAASWLRLGWPLRVATYLPFAFAAVAFLRNATGTDPSLRFNLSPWPAVPVFGLEAAALFIAAWLLGVALGLRGIAEWRRGPGGASRLVLGVVVGIAVPIAILAAGARLSLFPFAVGRGAYLASALVCALAIGLSASLGVRRDAERTRLRSLYSGVGAGLVLLPILVGQAWARVDYFVTREQRAREIIDALQTWFDREGLYPDELDLLVESRDLAAIPRPAIGFGFLNDDEFRYRSFGTSFLLEFPAPRWVECAYTPPFEDEDDEEEDVEAEAGSGELEAWERPPASAPPADEGAPDAAEAERVTAEDVPDEDGAAGEDGGLGEAWSCPSKPPELW